MILLSGEAQEAVTQVFVRFEHARKLGRDRCDILMVNASCGHALVLGIHKDCDASGLKCFSDAVCDLSRHGFLGLQTLAENLDDAGNLGNPDDLVRRHIGDVRLA